MISIDSKSISSLYNKDEIYEIESYIHGVLEPCVSDSAYVKLTAIQTNESNTLMATVSTKMIIIKTRVTAKTKKETIRKFKIHLTKEVERNKTKL